MQISAYMVNIGKSIKEKYKNNDHMMGPSQPNYIKWMDLYTQWTYIKEPWRWPLSKFYMGHS